MWTSGSRSSAGPLSEREVEIGAEDLHARDTLQQACFGSVPAADVEQLPVAVRRVLAPIELDADEVLAILVRVGERELVVLKGEPLRAEARLGQTLARSSVACGRAVAVDGRSVRRGKRRVDPGREVQKHRHMPGDRVPDTAGGAQEQARLDQLLVSDPIGPANGLEHVQLELFGARGAQQKVDQPPLHPRFTARS